MIRKMKHIFLAVLIITGIHASKTSLRAESPSIDQLREMVQIARALVEISNDFDTRRALEIAKQTGNDSVMLAAMHNRNPGIRLKAVELMAELPPDKAKAALIVVLSDNYPWSNRLIAGSDYLTVQTLFTETVQRLAAKFFGINADGYDLFDGFQRAELIKRIQTKQEATK